MRERPPMTPQAARDLANRALAFVAADAELAASLLGASGATADSLRSMAETPEFSVFLLDFLLEDDRRVLAFAEAERLPAQTVLAARMALEGPTDWL